MLIAEKLSTLSAINVSICRAKSLPTGRIRAAVVGPMSLPVVTFDDFIWIGRCSLLGRGAGGEIRRSRRLVWLENVQALKLLIQNRQRLELLGLDHLGFEPILDFILLYFFEILVIIVEMSIEAQ